MNEVNMFRLTARVARIKSGYRVAIRLLYRRNHDDWRGVNVAYSNPTRSRDEAEKEIPPVLADKRAYEEEVARAIERVKNSPTEVYKVFAVTQKGELRSPYFGVPYRMGALHAHPIIPGYLVGIDVYPDFEKAYWDAMKLVDNHGTVVIVRCAAGNMVDMWVNDFVTDAVIPLEIERFVILSDLRLRADGTVEEWDDIHEVWRKTSVKYEPKPPDKVFKIGSYRYLITFNLQYNLP